eukprot:679917-Pelagomonas_calceolata.AAC.1
MEQHPSHEFRVALEDQLGAGYCWQGCGDVLKKLKQEGKGTCLVLCQAQSKSSDAQKHAKSQLSQAMCENEELMPRCTL